MYYIDSHVTVRIRVQEVYSAKKSYGISGNSSELEKEGNITAWKDDRSQLFSLPFNGSLQAELWGLKEQFPGTFWCQSQMSFTVT